MIVDLFIRTYKKDLGWLQYSLRSIHKYLTGFRRIIVCIPHDQVHLLKDFNLPYVVGCPIYEDDYLGQQISKIYAFNNTDADIIMYWDSDLILYAKSDVSEYMDGEKIISYKTLYSKIGTNWKSVVEKALGKEVEYEYMRRHPFLYYRDTLINCVNEFRERTGENLSDYIKRQPAHEFTEFNYISSYVDSTKDPRYIFNDTDNTVLPEVKLKQFWSWSNLTPSEREEIEGMLK